MIVTHPIGSVTGSAGSMYPWLATEYAVLNSES